MNVTAQRAARWWADRLRQRPIMDSGVLENDVLLLLGAATKPPLDTEEIARFETALAGLITMQISAGWQRITIGVDYEADTILIDAWKIAGILVRPSARFPIKTFMDIEGDSITVAVGYGGRLTPIE